MASSTHDGGASSAAARSGRDTWSYSYPSPDSRPRTRSRSDVGEIAHRISKAFTSLKIKKTEMEEHDSKDEGNSEIVNSDFESDDSDGESATHHSQRVSRLTKQRESFYTLDRKQKDEECENLFEYVLVVSLRKVSEPDKYEPCVTYRFPPIDPQATQPEEEHLPSIPLFCFPDADMWAPVPSDAKFRSETFAFVLTCAQGSRQYGYCRRMLPQSEGQRLPETYCIISKLGCFNLYSLVLDEVEKRRATSPSCVFSFLKFVISKPIPHPGAEVEVKIQSWEKSCQEIITLKRPLDTRLEHVNFSLLFSFLSVPVVIKIFASILLERRIIFTAKKLSTLSTCIHALTALIYPFIWDHTYIPVLPLSLLDICCCPTPYIVGVLSVCIPEIEDMPLEEVLMVDIDHNKFIRQIGDESLILPSKLQQALNKAIYNKEDIQKQRATVGEDCGINDQVVTESFVRFFVEILSTYRSHFYTEQDGSRHFRSEVFRKSMLSKGVRRFLKEFMHTQMFDCFINKQMDCYSLKGGLFDRRLGQYLDDQAALSRGVREQFRRRIARRLVKSKTKPTPV